MLTQKTLRTKRVPNNAIMREVSQIVEMIFVKKKNGLL
jgi:hypothetical protein